MTTLIRAVEVWALSADGQLLEHAGGLYPGAAAFGHASRQRCFGRAEGLPGQAWDEARPVLLQTFKGTTFQRTALAEAAGYHSAVAVPIYLGARLTSVVLLFCGPCGVGQGAIELWHNDPRITGDLRLAAGLFGADSQALQSQGEDGFLPRGAGLPGQAWQRNTAVFADQIDDSTQFLRAQAAAAAGIVRGLAVPCATPSAHTWVLNLLSSTHSPIARRVESWLPVADGKGLQRSIGHCEIAGTLPAGLSLPFSASPKSAADGPIAQAFVTGLARVSDGLIKQPDALTASAAAVGLGSVLALPITDGDLVGEVLALYF